MKGIPLRKDTAMTGEISLQGFVLPVGGIKEKCLAALRYKIKRIILPFQNKQDTEDFPKEMKKQIEFIFVKNFNEVIENAFEGNIFQNKNISNMNPKF